MGLALFLLLSAAPNDLVRRLAEVGYHGAKEDGQGVSLEVRGETLAHADAVLLRFEEAAGGAVLVSAWPLRSGGVGVAAAPREALLRLLASNRTSEASAAIDEDGDLSAVLRIERARWRSPRLGRILADLLARADGLLEALEAQPSEDGQILFELRWTGSADLDLDLYRLFGRDGRDSEFLASAASLPPDERDILEGGGEPERILLSGRLLEDTVLVAVSFWAVGPSGETEADAILSARAASGEIEERRFRLALPNRRNWFAVRRVPGRPLEWLAP